MATPRLAIATALTLALAAATVPVSAQAPAADKPGVAADPADFGSIDAIITAVYDVISGEAGEERDWNRFRSLFDTEARLIPTAPAQDEAEFSAQMWGVEDYIERAGPSLAASGFFEVESKRVMELFENIAHVFSTYESRRTPDGEVFMRGINSIS